MTKIHEPSAVRVTCPEKHYLGSCMNLVNTRPVYCEVCDKWFEWTELEVGKKKRQREEGACSNS